LNSTIVIGLATSGVAVGVRQPGQGGGPGSGWLNSLWREPARRRELADLLLSRLGRPWPITQCRVVEAPELWFSEQGALGALRTAIADTCREAGVSTTGGGLAATVVLDDLWANHAILHGDFRNMRVRDVEALARIYFGETFGLDGEVLLVRTALQPGGRSVFASAIPRLLHDGIRDACNEANVKVHGLTVALPRLLDRIRNDVAEFLGVVVVVQEHLLQIVAMDRRQWMAYDALRLFGEGAADASGIAEEVTRVLERSLVCAPEVCMVCLVCLDGIEVDVSEFEQRFAGVRTLSGMPAGPSPAMRLIGLAP